MDEFVEAYSAYGDALGITKPGAPAPDEESLIELLRVFTQTIVAYAMHVPAFAALAPENGASARRPLAPIDAFRDAASRRGGGRDDDSKTGDFALPEGAPAPDAPLPTE